MLQQEIFVGELGDNENMRQMNFDILVTFSNIRFRPWFFSASVFLFIIFQCSSNNFVGMILSIYLFYGNFDILPGY